MKTNYLRGIGYMILSALAVALISLFGKALTSDLNLTTIVFVRFVFPFVLFLAILLPQRKLAFSFQPFPAVMLRSLCAVLSQYCFFYYLFHSSILNATLLFCTGPIFVPFISYFIMRTPIKRKAWIVAVVSFIGVALVLNPNSSIFNEGVLIGLGAGFFNGCSQVTFHHLSKKNTAASMAITMYAVSSVFTLIPVLLMQHWHIKLEFYKLFTQEALIISAILIAVISVANQFLRGKAYKLVNKAASLTPFIYMSIVFAGILEWMVYGQVPTLMACLGIALIIVSGCYIYIAKK